MSELWVDIEQLVLDGVPLDRARGRRVALLTEMALERLLRERGVSAATSRVGPIRAAGRRTERAEMKSPPARDETRWAEDLAKILLRAIDRST
jgi:hypothetical protein